MRLTHTGEDGFVLYIPSEVCSRNINNYTFTRSCIQNIVDSTISKIRSTYDLCHGSNTPVLQETLENVLTATIVLTTTLVVLEVTSVT